MFISVKNTRKKCLIDNIDFLKVSEKTWTLAPTGYLVSDTYEYGPRKQILLHRFLLGLTLGDGKIVDHINGNKLDNRRNNLRLVSSFENSLNRRSNRLSSAGYRGVKFTSEGRPYRASIRVGKIVLYSKRFEKAEDAAKEYDRMAKKHHGSFAVLNFK